MPLTVADIQRDYINLDEQHPTDGSRVEVVQFVMPRLRSPLRNYFIYEGTTISSQIGHLELDIHRTDELNGGNQLATVRNAGHAILNTRGLHLIYWRDYNPITTAKPPALQHNEGGPMSPTTYKQAAEETEMTDRPLPKPVTLEFGGRKTKRRKTKRKSRRKNRG